MYFNKNTFLNIFFATNFIYYLMYKNKIRYEYDSSFMSVKSFNINVRNL